MRQVPLQPATPRPADASERLTRSPPQPADEETDVLDVLKRALATTVLAGSRSHPWGLCRLRRRTPTVCRVPTPVRRTCRVPSRYVSTVSRHVASLCSRVGNRMGWWCSRTATATPRSPGASTSRTAEEHGVIAVAMDYRGTESIRPEERGDLPSARGWQVAEALRTPSGLPSGSNAAAGASNGSSSTVSAGVATLPAWPRPREPSAHRRRGGFRGARPGFFAAARLAAARPRERGDRLRTGTAVRC